MIDDTKFGGLPPLLDVVTLFDATVAISEGFANVRAFYYMRKEARRSLYLAFFIAGPGKFGYSNEELC